MSDRRPLPDSDEVEDRRANERLVRWAAILVGSIIAASVGLMALRWVLQG